MSPAMRMGPGGGCRSAAAAGDLLDAGPVPDDGLGVRSARLCHKCQRSATWIAPGARPAGTLRLSTHQPKVGLTELTMGGIVDSERL
jgi:hypothetical protein